MSDQIKPGDLVMVVKPTPCCHNFHGVGEISKVASIHIEDFVCYHCNFEMSGALVQTSVGWFAPVTVLKKLNPPADEETRETTKELEVV